MSRPAARTDLSNGSWYTLSLPPEWVETHPVAAHVRQSGLSFTMPSVTSAISNMDKPGLTWGAAGETVSYMIQNLDETTALLGSALTTEERGDRECKACGRPTDNYLADKGWWIHKECLEPWKQVRKQFQLRWNQKRDRGSFVHDVVEAHILGDDIDPTTFGEHEGFVKAWLRFVERHQPTFLMSEATVFSLRHGYAGTLDIIMDVGGARWLVDVKTSPKTYVNHLIQLAAYRHADGIYVDAGVVEPLPEVDEVAILLLGEDSYKFVTMPEGIDDRAERNTATADAFERAFLSLLTLHRWKTGTA